jgi:hypothetical protein
VCVDVASALVSTPLLTVGLEASGPETVSGLSSVGGVLAPAENAGIVGSTRRSGVLSAAWVELLGRYEWAWFVTFTFKDAVHPEAADKKFRYWVGQVAQSYLGKNWRRKRQRQPVWVRGLEWQKREVLHYHALVGNLPRLYVAAEWRSFFWQLWRSLDNAGLARVDPCNGRDELYSYLSKYVAKGGEIDISPNLDKSTARLAFG